LVRERVFATLSIGGLAVGIAASLLAFIYAWHELSYDRFIPGYRTIYRVSTTYWAPGAAVTAVDPAPADVAKWLSVRLPNLKQVARLTEDVDRPARVGGVASLVKMYWADPAFFQLFRFQVLGGDAPAALAEPDAVVITHSVARQLFGRDVPVGQTVQIDGKHFFRVAAVIADLPKNTHLTFGIVASSKSAQSPFWEPDSQAIQASKAWIAHTYFRLPPTVSLEQVGKVLDEFTESASTKQTGASGMRMKLAVTPIAAIHLQPKASGSLKPRGNRTAIAATAAVGALILLVAVINFVNLATARVSTRAVEIGVRKSVGVSRLALLTQFTVEASVCTALAGLLSFAIVGLCIPTFDSMAQPTLETSDVYQPIVIAGLVGLLVCVALLSVGYPAFVLSSIRPAVGLRDRSGYSGGGWVRRVLVGLQFAILTGLLIGVVALFAQTCLHEKLRMA